MHFVFKNILVITTLVVHTSILVSDLKPENFWHVHRRALLRLQVTICHEKEMGKGSAKVGTVYISLVLASGEKDFLNSKLNS